MISRIGRLIAIVFCLSVPWLATGQTTPAIRTLTIATIAPDGSTWMRVFDAWNRELRRRTNSQLQFRFYPNGVQGDETEIVRKIRAGRLDGGAMTAVGLAAIHRPTIAFQIPGMFENYAQLDHARDAVRSDLDREFDHAGFALLGWGDVGTERIFANIAVRSPADFTRTHPFLWRDDPIFPAFMAQIGMQGVAAQIPEVLTQLQTHRIDNVVASPLAVASMQWASNLSHMNDMPIAMDIGAILIGREQLQSLSPQLRQILRETGAQFTQLMVRNVRRDDDATIPQMQQRGLIIDSSTPSQRAEWDAIFAGTRTRLAGQIGSAAWLERIRAARN